MTAMRTIGLAPVGPSEASVDTLPCEYVVRLRVSRVRAVRAARDRLADARADPLAARQEGGRGAGARLGGENDA
jgi:hypothetical protein